MLDFHCSKLNWFSPPSWLQDQTPSFQIINLATIDEGEKPNFFLSLSLILSFFYSLFFFHILLFLSFLSFPSFLLFSFFCLTTSVCLSLSRFLSISAYVCLPLSLAFSQSFSAYICLSLNRIFLFIPKNRSPHTYCLASNFFHIFAGYKSHIKK